MGAGVGPDVPKPDARRDALYGSLSEADLLTACEGRFQTLLRQPLENGRILFLFAKE